MIKLYRVFVLLGLICATFYSVALADQIDDMRAHDNASRPYMIRGVVTVGDKSFPYVSGGFGRGSMPFGDYPISLSVDGEWGKKHQALGLPYDINDPKYKDDREAIEIHGPTKSGGTEGCMSITTGWETFRQMVQQNFVDGDTFLHVDAFGAVITNRASLLGLWITSKLAEIFQPPPSAEPVPLYEIPRHVRIRIREARAHTHMHVAAEHRHVHVAAEHHRHLAKS